MKNTLKLIVLFLPFIVNAQYTESGCVAYLPFSGSMRDSTANQLDASTHAGTISYGTDRFGNANSAAVFDGNTVLTLGSDSKFRPSDEYTICIWLRVSTFTSFNTAVSMRYNDQSAPYCSFSIASGTLLNKKASVNVSTTNNTDQLLQTGDVTDLQWHHVAMSYSSTSQELRLYFDGVLVEKKATTGSIIYNGSASLMIGGPSPTFKYGQQWNGSLDEFRFYDKELSGDRIRQIAEKFGTGIKSENSVTQISIFPNPATQNIKIETDQMVKNIYIYDLQGKMVLQTTNSNKQIFVGDLTKGLYLIKITTEEGIVNKKIVIE